MEYVLHLRVLDANAGTVTNHILNTAIDCCPRFNSTYLPIYGGDYGANSSAPSNSSGTAPTSSPTSTGSTTSPSILAPAVNEPCMF